MKKCYLDTETCGLHGLPVLLQYSFNGGPILLHDIWLEPIKQTLDILQEIAECCVVGFNLCFDWFHVCKLWTTLVRLPGDWVPAEHINAVAVAEARGPEGDCIKPAGALDLMLFSRTGPYQSLMARREIRINKVPRALAERVAQYLESNIEIDLIHFARTKNKNAPRWRVAPMGDFCDVVLKFNAAGGLKYLAEHALKVDNPKHYDNPCRRPIEFGFAPCALSISNVDQDWAIFDDDFFQGHAWPGVIKEHVDYWATDKTAREYATADVDYTRRLDKYFDAPINDTNSILACQVAASRWRGFAIDGENLERLLVQSLEIVESCPINFNRVAEVRRWLSEAMTPVERLLLDISTTSTDEKTLLEVAGWEGEAGRRASQILDSRQAKKEVETFEKLLLAGRFHPSFSVVGTLSNRMSGGGGGMNPQGIKSTSEVRRCFPLASGKDILCGGDFDSFEVSIAAKIYEDKNLTDALLSGQKIHGLFGQCLYPDLTYDEILSTKGQSPDLYAQAKGAVFAMLYGGDSKCLQTNLGLSAEVADSAFARWHQLYPGTKKAETKIHESFCSMTQPGGLGTQVIFKEPADYVESLRGFRRYFVLENKICKALFDLANDPPSEWLDERDPVTRRQDRGEQTAHGATRSALFAAAFSIQQQNLRSCINHVIQSTGGSLTKDLQRAIWGHQPAGVAPWFVSPLNIHDEIMCVVSRSHVDQVAETVRQTLIRFQGEVPLIEMTWYKSCQNWSEKESGGESVHVGPRDD